MRNLLIGFSLLMLAPSATAATASTSLRDEAKGYREEGLKSQRYGDLEEAVTWYQKAAHLDAAFAVPHNDLGVVYERQGHAALALQSYEQALTIDPNYLEASANLGSLYKRLGRFTYALPRLTKAAVLFEQRGDLPTAQRLYQEVLEIRPDHLEALSGLAGIFERQGERDQAVAMWLRVAMLYEQRAQFEAAKAAYERAVAMDATSVDAVTNLASLYQRTGKRDLAVLYWLKAGELHERRGDLQTARHYYERALKLNPNSAETLANLAVVSEQLGDRRQAVAYWTTCRQLSSPTDPWRLRAEERLVELGVIKAGSAYRRHVVEQEFQTNIQTGRQFHHVTQERW
ncbi:MAG: tetratricopeptide repeat protein [Candidatus Omnitrophica bacterium]|nr:tetratricopeptide repeat protein [Candidatus Omnitrophota bacterium]